MVTFTITNKSRPKATIVMLIGMYGKQYRKSIGIGVPPRYWSDAKKRAKTTADFDGRGINDTIYRWNEIGNAVIKAFEGHGYPPTPEEVVDVITRLSSSEQPNNTSQFYTDYFENVYIPRYTGVRGVDTLKGYIVAMHKLRDYEHYRKSKLLFESIDINFYNSFRTWFYEQNFSRNYFGNIVKIIKQVYNEARSNDHLHDLHGTEHRDFVSIRDTADTVYLTLDELDTIRDLNISSDTIQDKDHPLPPQKLKLRVEALRRARGLFLIGCYTGLRVSDFSRLREAHVGEFITIKTAKTGAEVVIPIHPVVRELLDSGFDLSNSVSDQKLNKQIKELCRRAGIDTSVMVNKNIGGRFVEEVFPKYELVSSHTARRSFATNAYKAGVPTIAIMKITGHTKESTFLKYIKVSATENAEILKNHPFFKGQKNG